MSDDSSLLIALLERLRAGDPAARNDLIGHTRERFRLLTRQMLRNFPGVRQWEETSDVLQNVLIRIDRVLQAVPLESPRDFLRLANTQIRRELLDTSRRLFGPNGLGANLVPPGQGKGHDAPPDPSDSSADPYQLARWHELHSKIADLNEEQRELFELIYYQGLTQSQAADLLGMPLTTLKRRWKDARLAFMMRMGDDLPF